MNETKAAWSISVALLTLSLNVENCLGQEPQVPAILSQRTIERAHYRTVHSLAWSPDSRSLVSGSSDFRATLWSIPELKAVHWLPRHRGSVYSVAFSPSGNLFASAGHHGLVRVYASDSGELLHEIESGNGAVSSMTFLGDDDRLLLGRRDGELQVWDPFKNLLVERFDCTAVILSVTYSPREQRIAASVFRRATRGPAESAGVLVWHYSDDTLSTLQGLNGNTSGVAFSPSGKLIAGGGWDGRIRIWDVQTGMSVHELEGHRVSTTSVKFSPDEQILASTGQDAAVRLWSVSSGDLISEFEPFSNGTGCCVRFSPNGEYLAAGGGYDPGEIIVWSFGNAAEAGSSGIDSAAQP